MRRAALLLLVLLPLSACAECCWLPEKPSCDFNDKAKPTGCRVKVARVSF